MSLLVIRENPNTPAAVIPHGEGATVVCFTGRGLKRIRVSKSGAQKLQAMIDGPVVNQSRQNQPRNPRNDNDNDDYGGPTSTQSPSSLAAAMGIAKTNNVAMPKGKISSRADIFRSLRTTRSMIVAGIEFDDDEQAGKRFYSLDEMVRGTRYEYIEY